MQFTKMHAAEIASETPTAKAYDTMTAAILKAGPQ
jgi:hypothetical protein